MVTTLIRLRETLNATKFAFATPDVAEHRSSRDDMVDQLDDYVLPRLIQIEAPVLCVVGGSTGAGKSTLVNSLVGERVTESGVLRPTTRSPVLVHHPEDADWFEEQRILPDLERTSRTSADPGALQLVSSEQIPQGLAVLDAPDIDSVEERNRVLASQLLGAADLWLFVTSAARYADQVPWDFLKRAAERSASVAIVLDRTPPKAVEEVSSHLARMLSSRGLKDSPLFVVTEGSLDEEGLLPPEAVQDIRTWLTDLGADADARNAVVRQTLEGVIRSLSSRTHEMADHAKEQSDIRSRLWREVDDSYTDAIGKIGAGAADGTLLRGEVLSRWQEFVGAGELLKSLESKVSWLRDRITKAVKGQPVQARQVEVAVESGLLTLVIEHAERAAETVDAAWRSSVAGKQLLDDSGTDLSRASRDFRNQAERAIRDWQQGVIDLVRTEGADKRTSARFLAYGVNGLAVALMIVSFASTGGLVGAEIGIAGGSAIVAQKLLEAVFGDQAVRRLTQTAHEDLLKRIHSLMDTERARFIELLDEGGVDASIVEQLRDLARRIDDLRFSDGGIS